MTEAASPPTPAPSAVGIHISDIEAAINFWRQRRPASEGVSLSAPLRALAQIYGLMVFHQQSMVNELTMPESAYAAWLQWYDTTPDTPCIAICSTSQGDALCKGCGRRFDEVQHWPELNPAAKRSVWRRITQEGTAWRFNRYAERAAERQKPAPSERAQPSADQANEKAAGALENQVSVG